jgi:hypothetical protein
MQEIYIFVCQTTFNSARISGIWRRKPPSGSAETGNDCLANGRSEYRVVSSLLEFIYLRLNRFSLQSVL